MLFLYPLPSHPYSWSSPSILALTLKPIFTCHPYPHLLFLTSPCDPAVLKHVPRHSMATQEVPAPGTRGAHGHPAWPA